MKIKGIKTLVFLFFAIMIMADFTACGSKKEDNNLEKENNAEISKVSSKGSQEESEEDFVYQAMFQTVKESLSWIQGIYVDEENVVLVGSSYEKLKGEKEERNHFYLLTCHPDGSNAEKKEIPFDEDDFIKVITIYHSDDGELKIDAVVSNNNKSKKNKKNKEISNTGYYLYTVDLQGKIITSCGLNLKDNNSNFYISSSSYISKEGNFYAIADSCIYAFDIEGNQSGIYNFGEQVYGVVPISSEELFVLGAAHDSGSVWKLLDLKTKEFGKANRIKDYDFFSASLHLVNNKIFIEYNNSVYQFDLKTKEITPLFSWVDFGISNMFFAFTVDQQERIIAANSKTEDGNEWIELGFLEKVKALEAEKTVLTLAVVGPSDSLNEKIIEFNKYNENCRIRIMDYSNYEDANAQINLDVASGIIPDIVCINNMAIEQYEKKGMFTDLYPFMEQDTEIKKEDFIESVRKAMEVDGKLYYMGDTFEVSALAGSKQVIGDRKSWTIEEMKEIYNTLPKDSTFMENIRRQGFLRYFLQARMSDYVDWRAGEVYFNSKEFIEILNFSKNFPDQSESMESMNNAGKDLEDGKVMVETIQLAELYRIQLFSTLYQDLGGFSVVDYPSVEENETLSMRFNGTFLAITEQCEEKEMAWQFLRQFLNYEHQKALYLDEEGLPTRIDAFEKWLEYAQAEKEYTEDDGTKIKPIHGNDMFYDKKIKLRPLNKEEVEIIKEIVKRVGNVNNYTGSKQVIGDIVLEEAESFFAGDKTAEQTAEIIQNRVKLYLSENS